MTKAFLEHALVELVYKATRSLLQVFEKVDTSPDHITPSSGCTCGEIMHFLLACMGLDCLTED